MRKEMASEEMNQVNGGAATEITSMTVDYNEKSKGYDVFQNNKKIATFYNFDDADKYVSNVMGTTPENF